MPRHSPCVFSIALAHYGPVFAILIPMLNYHFGLFYALFCFIGDKLSIGIKIAKMDHNVLRQWKIRKENVVAFNLNA